jgi:serine/threonine protein kinase
VLAIDHPNLVRMFDAGRTEAEGSDLIYAVCEYPDDVLSTVLRDRPLGSSEAREVLNATLSALSFLHENGLVNGAVDPSHIMAFGDRVKLPSDSIRRAGQAVPAFEPGPYDAPEVAAGSPATPGSDMWSLGITLHEILTQQPPKLASDTEFLYMAEPFATILRHTLKPDPSERWTVRDIENHLNPPPPLPKPVPEPVAEPVAEIRTPLAATAGIATAAASSASNPPEPDRMRTAPRLAPVALPPRPPRQPRPDPPIDRGFPLKWVPIAGLAAAVTLSAILFHKPDRPRAESPTPVQRTAAVTPEPVTRPAPPPVSRSAPAVADTKPSPIPEKNRQASRSDQPTIWRVVVYTYANRQAAEKKAHSINEKNPEWRAAVFAPKGDRAPYYISLSGRMTYAEAERLQKRAVSKGLPRDTFVRNFTN